MTEEKQKQLGKTLWTIAVTKQKHNRFLKELGLSPLPWRSVCGADS